MGRIQDYGKFVDGSLDGLETFAGKQLFDSEIGYRFDAINVSVGARNLFNVFPDKVTIEVKAGDVVRLLTPGGGGWGPPAE